jgi:ferredoxin
LELDGLKQEIKRLISGTGANLVGVGSRDRLKDAPPSGDMDYCLEGAQSCIIWAYAPPIDALRNYFSKTERMSIKKFQHFAYSTAWKTAETVAAFIEKNSEYKAFPMIPNGKYRTKKPGKTAGYGSVLNKDGTYPDFSLRYGAVAAGLGHLGWSGNVVTSTYGGSLYLGGVLTTAPLEPDPMAEENHCNRCLICANACTTGYVSKEEAGPPVIIGGMEEVCGKRNNILRCVVGCAGWTGLSPDGTWTNWSPGQVCLQEVPEVKISTTKYKISLFASLFVSPRTPRQYRRFNNTIRKSFMGTPNVGMRSVEDTNPRCGFCSLICVADPRERKELLHLLKESGKVYLDEKGQEIVKKT